MKYTILLTLFLSTTAIAGDIPEYATMRSGAVCTLEPWGNFGQFNGQNYLGMNYETCRFPGIDAIKALRAGTPPDLPKCTSSGPYPCYIVKYKQDCDSDELVAGGAPCTP